MGMTLFAGDRLQMVAVAFLVGLLPCFVGSGAHSGEGVGEVRALCVGLVYPGTGYPLNYCTNDARNIAEAIGKNSGQNTARMHVEVLVDDDAKSPKPTAREILRRLHAMADTASGDDKLIFSFSGHGLASDDGTKTILIAHGGDGMRDANGYLYLAEVREALRSSRARDKLIIIDACHSGGKSAGETGLAGDLTPPTPMSLANSLAGGAKDGDGEAWLVSCDVSQKSYEDEDTRQGLFTRFLLEAIRGTGKGVDLNYDGKVSVFELHRYISRSIQSYIHNKAENPETAIWASCDQTPRMGLGGNMSLAWEDTVHRKLKKFNVLYFGDLPETARVAQSNFDGSLTLNKQVTRFTRFNLLYTIRSVAHPPKKVEIYITDDMGDTWRLYGEDPDLVSPMTIEVPGEGTYGFLCGVTDRFGNREGTPTPRTHPQTVITVDRTPPTANWQSPLQNYFLGQEHGQVIELTWTVNDPNLGTQPVKIQYSTDARSNFDRDASWIMLQENLVASGSVNWIPPAEGRYFFRLIAEDLAGNLAIAYNPAIVVFDTTPPRIISVSPLKSNKLTNDILVEAEDDLGGSGIKDVSLYISDNAGSTWHLLKEPNESGASVQVRRTPDSRIVFTAPRPGKYALWPVVSDECGNTSSLPKSGIQGANILYIDTENR